MGMLDWFLDIIECYFDVRILVLEMVEGLVDDEVNLIFSCEVCKCGFIIVVLL